jgi:hypothetical protein
MYEVAVYLLDEKYHREIVSSLVPPHYLVHISSDIKEIITFCETDMIDSVLIWPAKKPLVSNLMDLMKKRKLDYLPVIPVVRTPEDFHAILNLEIANIIQIPLPRKEFFSILQSALNAGFESDKPIVSLPPVESTDENTGLLEALNLSHKNKNDALISVNAGGHIGRIYIRRGEIVRANFRILEGMDALRKLLNLANMDLTIHYTQVDEEDLLDWDTSEILSELQSYSQEVKSALKKQGATEIYRTRDDVDLDAFRKNEMEYTILSLCREGDTIFNAFAVMNQENLKILNSIQTLISKGILVSSETEITAVSAQSKKWRLKILFQSLSRLWRKEKSGQELSHSEETTFPESDESAEAVSRGAKMFGVAQKLDDITIDKIQKFLTEL